MGIADDIRRAVELIRAQPFAPAEPHRHIVHPYEHPVMVRPDEGMDFAVIPFDAFVWTRCADCFEPLPMWPHSRVRRN